MGLESRYKDSFSKSQKEKGSELYTKKAVSYIQGNDNSVNAEVSAGSECYEVLLKCTDKELKIFCDCHSVHNKPCEHIWASLLAAENLFLLKDGAKRGVRLSGTAASKNRKHKNTPPISVIPVEPLSLPASNLYTEFNIADKEILYVVNKSRSNWFESCFIEFFWRPINHTSPIKPYTPDVLMTGLSSVDKSIIKEISKSSQSTSNGMLLKNIQHLKALLESIFETERLYTRVDSTQFKFAKVKQCLKEDIDWEIVLNSEGYEIKGFCNSEPITQFIALGDNVILLPRVLIFNDKQSYKKLFI